MQMPLKTSAWPCAGFRQHIKRHRCRNRICAVSILLVHKRRLGVRAVVFTAHEQSVLAVQLHDLYLGSDMLLLIANDVFVADTYFTIIFLLFCR